MWQDFIELLFIPGELALNMFVSLILSFLLGMAIALLYKNTHRGLNYEHSFLSTLVLLPPIVTMVMMFIRGDLVLSLGLVGSLSIIRFRTPIKDTRDMVYLFWVIAVGLGSGTDNWTLVIIATILLSIVIAVLYLAEYGRPKHSDFVLVLSGTSDYPAAHTKELINRYASTARVRSYEVSGDNWETIYELRFTRSQEKEADALLKSMQQIEGIDRVSLLAPQLALPM
ncbi:DUF4956 domain-containing protein [Dethiobacter alkaliphilus]|uniref:DUF4956 domain-containing protein n=1 Tax=Dethiobacter alkaliphilus AHT 1 TaxID=555088 RepID=C0GEB1_DETAL|nr:DUF4956 domain-containing protein [Dethiobacter alkaliphilus]EEG78405.1 conserved hypothetical protein [Dethiobacter alkaliphilus AHT 1]